MPATILTGRVLMKAGADRRTLNQLRALIGELEMDQKPLTLTTAFPTMLWTGSKELTQPADGSSAEPDCPVILFSIMDRVGREADVHQLAKLWQEQVLGANSRNILISGVEPPPKLHQRLLRELRGGRPHFSLLEKIGLGALAIQLIGFSVIAYRIRHSTHPAHSTIVTEALAPASLASVKPVVDAPALIPLAPPEKPPRPAPPAEPTHKIPRVKIKDIVYLNGGRQVVKWGSLGKGFNYRVYVSKDAAMKGAHPALSFAFPYTEYIVTRTTSADWLAIRAVTPDGQYGPFSEPTYIGF
jgi:hypothetical protein